MTDLVPFDFDGLDQSAIGFHPDHGPLVHKVKFMKWLGLDTTNSSRSQDRHLQPGDVVAGVFSPIGLSTKGGRKADALTKRGVQRLTGQPSDDEVMKRLSDALNTGSERAAEDKATRRAAKAVADAAGKQGENRGRA